MPQAQHYDLISKTIKWMAEHQSEQPGLDRLSTAMGVSPHHLQRTFQRWAGVSPKQFLKSLTRKAALARLEQGCSVLDAALESGLSGPGRLHDLLISTDALTPGEIRKRGEGIQLDYGFGETLFGQALIAWTSRGVNFLGFCQEEGPEQTLWALRHQWSNAGFAEDFDGAQRWLDTIFCESHDKPIPLWLRGSSFQLKVWEALLKIPEGTHATYGQMASLVGHPGAARAVGTAIGSNPIAYIIPCHRVIRQIGETGGYRWGETTKKAIIGYEAVSIRA
jgi:AraC family transcriptional regulator of adaptative response/methylated-DNA-[protein]-cysteine methyltransferase